MFKIVWFLAWALAVTTAILGLIAFRSAGQFSPFAIANWMVIAMSLAASPFFLWEIHAIPSIDEKAARARLVRMSILMYLPLSSALALLAFYGK